GLGYRRQEEPEGRLAQTPIRRSAVATAPSEALRFGASAAASADALRGGGHPGDWAWSDTAASARAARGEDRWGLRAEFVELVERARRLVAGDDAQPPRPAAIAR